MAENIDKLIERLDDKCHRLICMVFAVAGLSTEDPRIDDFADDRGQGPDTINLCIDSGLIKQVGSADEGENFRLVPGWWPHSLPSEWRRLILGSLKQSCDIQSLRSRVSELEAERENLLTHCLQVEENEAALIAERDAAFAAGAQSACEACERIATAAAVDLELIDRLDGQLPAISAFQDACNYIAAAIRARGNTDTGPQAQVRAETSAPVVPDGWQLVPKEPSWEILIDHGIDSETWAAMLAASPTPPAAEAVGGALADIAAERCRQIKQEGWSPDHDDSHSRGELAQAAGCYALHAGLPAAAQVRPGFAPQDWPWAAEWWKPKDPRRDLVRAAALIVAEIERLDRMSELQRDRGDVAGQDGTMQDCALKGTGPAAPTAGCEDSQLLAAFDRCRAEIIDSSLCDASESLSSLVFSQLSDFRLRLHEYFLAKSGPAASTASDVVKEVARVIEAAEREYRLTAGIDDPDEFIARAVLSSPPVREIVGTLDRIVDSVSVGPSGEVCQCGDFDEARSILSRFQSVGGEKHDHADGTSAEAVEKVTPADKRRQ